MTSGKVMISLSIWPRAAAGENKRSRATRQLGSRESQEDCAEFEESTRALLASSRLGRQFPLQGKGEQGEPAVQSLEAEVGSHDFAVTPTCAAVTLTCLVKEWTREW